MKMLTINDKQLKWLEEELEYLMEQKEKDREDLIRVTSVLDFLINTQTKELETAIDNDWK